MPTIHGSNQTPRKPLKRVSQFFGIMTFAAVALVAARQPRVLEAHDAEPTFAVDVAPILYKNCTSCHHTGGLGPFSLIEFDSAKANIKEMRDALSTKQMPPWHAEGPHGTFLNDRRLSEEDISTIVRWIDSGAKPGDLSKLPPRPVYATGWSIGTPDAVVSMPEDFVVPATGTVEYQYFEIPTGLTEDKWVQAIEILPGAREVVHHVLVYAKVPPTEAELAQAAAAAAQARANRASATSATGATSTTAVTSATGAPGAAPAAPPVPLLLRNQEQSRLPRPTLTDTRHPPPRQMGSLIGTTAPGTNVLEMPAGTALRLRAGTVLVFQMHYTAKGHEMHDRTKVGFRFAKSAPEAEMFATSFQNGSFKIPAGASDVAVPSEVGVSRPIKVWALFPHTHVRGTKWQYKLEKPDGTSEVILDVPHYDFNWQTYYMFAKPLDITPGSKITSMAWYDNSAKNKNNPDATKDVTWGDQTWEEMQYTGFLYTVVGRKVN